MSLWTGLCCACCFVFKQKTAYEMRISDWSSDVCSSDLDTASPMAERAGWNRLSEKLPPLRWSVGLSLTWRILVMNVLPLALLGGGIFYLDTYRKQLLTERYKLARLEAQITAEELAGANRQRQGRQQTGKTPARARRGT